MAAPTERAQDLGPRPPSALSNPEVSGRIAYALAQTLKLLDPTLSVTLAGMGQSPDQASAVIKRMSILLAKGDSVTTDTGLAYYSSDDKTEIGKKLPKPATLIKSSTGLGPAVTIDTPFRYAAVVTVRPPANADLMKFSFVNNEVFTPAEADGAEELLKRAPYLARWVILDADFPKGDSQGTGYLDIFVNSAYFDQNPPVKFNRGWNGFWSGWGLGTVVDASRHGSLIHVDESKKGKTIRTRAWEISTVSGLAHPAVGRKVDTAKS